MDMKSPDRILVIYEIKVPSRRSKPETVRNSIETIINKVKENSEYIDFLNVPEMIEENYEGKPFYKSVDVVPLGQQLQQNTGKSVIVNKVVGHFSSRDEFVSYIKDSKNNHSIENFVLVGVANPHNKYPGPTVGEANKIASGMGINVGNICIPHRPDEIDRMLEKTRNGCSFFTTQILLEDDNMKKIILEYDRACKENNIQPARIFLSFAALEDDYDIEFFKWLGIEINPAIETEMKSADNMKEYSANRIKNVYDSILRFREENKISVPLGMNIAQVNVRNLDSSLLLLKELSQIRV